VTAGWRNCKPHNEPRNLCVVMKIILRVGWAEHVAHMEKIRIFYKM
jgi:hypothetical protein